MKAKIFILFFLTLFFNYGCAYKSFQVNTNIISVQNNVVFYQKHLEIVKQKILICINLNCLTKDNYATLDFLLDRYLKNLCELNSYILKNNIDDKKINLKFKELSDILLSIDVICFTGINNFTKGLADDYQRNYF